MRQTGRLHANGEDRIQVIVLVSGNFPVALFPPEDAVLALRIAHAWVSS